MIEQLKNFRKYINEYNDNIITNRYLYDQSGNSDNINKINFIYHDTPKFSYADNRIHVINCSIYCTIYVNLLNYEFDKYNFLSYLSEEYIFTDYSEKVDDDFLIIKLTIGDM